MLADGGARRYGGWRILDRVMDSVAAATGEAPLLVGNDPYAAPVEPILDRFGTGPSSCSTASSSIWLR